MSLTFRPAPAHTYTPGSISKGAVRSLNMRRRVHVYQINNPQDPTGSEFLAASSCSAAVLSEAPSRIPQGGSQFLYKYHCVCGLNTSENDPENAPQGSTDTQGYSGTQDPL